MSTKSSRLFYTILTYGKKPAGKIPFHPAASAQIANLETAFPPDARYQDRTVWEYARVIHCLDDLPRLKAILQEMTIKEIGLLIMDDVSRLFRVCKQPDRAGLLLELKPFADRLYSLRHGLTLSAFSDVKRGAFSEFPEQLAHWTINGVGTFKT